jgi:hypothetical protein
MTPRKLDLVGVHEIAERLDVPRSTISVWMGKRGWPKGNLDRPAKPPKPVALIHKGSVAVYRWEDVAKWARETGYLK